VNNINLHPISCHFQVIVDYCSIFVCDRPLFNARDLFEVNP